MAQSISFGEVNLDVEAGRARQPSKPEPETPFRIAVIGDFSGRANRAAAGGSPGSRPRAILVDRDNLDEVIAKLGVRLTVRIAGEPGEQGADVDLQFRELEDFEPDRVFARAELFRTLRESRRRLADPAKFESAAAELGLIRGAGETGSQTRRGAREESRPAREPAAGEDSPSTDLLSAGSLLEGALEATVERTQGGGGREEAKGSRPDELSDFLRRAVAPYAVADPHPKQDEVLASWDQTITDQMRAVMHHADYQALEAAWRGVQFLTRRLETGTDLKVYLVDCTKEELAHDLENCSDLRECRLAKALTDSNGDWAADPGWAVLAGLYRFDATVEDAILLARMSVVAGYLNAPFVAEAVPTAFGCPNVSVEPDPADWKRPGAEAAQSWNAVRDMPQSRYLALAAPRFLLRLPYGEETVPTEEFPFEEVSLEEVAGPRHEDYLWGNPALVGACLLGENFRRDGWDMRPGSMRQLEGLPMHLYKQGGEARQTPCAEAWLGERAADAMLEYGVLPLLSTKDRDAVVLFDLRSLAAGDEGLAGPWDS